MTRQTTALICLALAASMALARTIGAGAESKPQPYSYYSPATGTVNLENLAFEPGRIEARGRPFESDVVVLTGLSRTLARLTPAGKVRWMLDVAGGGGAYGLSSTDGLLAVSFGPDVLLVEPASGKVVERLPLLTPGSDRVISSLRVQDDLLIATESRPGGDIVIAKIVREHGRRARLNVVDRISTRMEAPRDALLLSPDQLLVADTFGHAVVLFERRSRWRETRRWAEYFPNMLDWRNGALTVLSEHANRIGRWSLQTNQRQVVVSCPHPLFADVRTKPQQLVAEEPRTRSGESPPRQICSTDIAGDQTLYAANGFFDEGNGHLWVADADNHRVALFVDGQFWGALTGINHPVRVIPVSRLH